MTQDLQAPVVIQVIQDLLVHQVARKEKRENQENQANEANKAKMVTRDLQVSLETKENQDFQALQAETERED